MLDSHCHLTDPRLIAQLDDVLARAAAAGVTRMMTIGTHLEDWQPCVAVAARHDIDGLARVQEPHRPGQHDLLCRQNQHFTFDAAQIGQSVLRRKTAAINCPIGAFRRLRRIHAKAQRDSAESGKPRSKPRHRRARIEMRFGRKKQGAVKAPFQIGLERRYSGCVNWLEAGSAAGKTGELRPVAGGRDDKRPALTCDSYGLCPELKRFEAEIENKLFRALGLAPGR